METFFSEIFYSVLLWKPLGYLLASFAMIVEGEVALLLSAFLTHEGYFNIRYIFLSLVLGSLAGDFLFYWLGHLISRSPIRFPKWLSRLVHPLDKRLLDKPAKIILISKFVYGTNRATLMRAGALRISLWEFFKTNLFAVVIWIVTIGGIGYFVGASLNLLKKYIRFAEIILLISLLVFLVVFHLLFKKYGEKI